MHYIWLHNYYAAAALAYVPLAAPRGGGGLGLQSGTGPLFGHHLSFTRRDKNRPYYCIVRRIRTVSYTHKLLHELSLLATTVISVVFCHSSPENVFKPRVLYKVTDTSKQISPLFDNLGAVLPLSCIRLRRHWSVLLSVCLSVCPLLACSSWTKIVKV